MTTGNSGGLASKMRSKRTGFATTDSAESCHKEPTLAHLRRAGLLLSLRLLSQHGLKSCSRSLFAAYAGLHPLTHRRKGTQPLSFGSEYDVQDLLHALLRPWVSDIRPEEFTPSYAGSSTRMDFLLPAHKLVIETKIVRDRAHAKRVGDELIVDIDHYRRHPSCQSLWCVIYDPDQLITNADGLKTDLQGSRSSNDGTVHVRVFVL